MNKNPFSNKINNIAGNFSLREKIFNKSKINNGSAIRIEPLAFSQQQIWVIDQIKPGNLAYNLPAGFRLKGNLNIEILEKSFNEIINRHETLRTTFCLINNQPKQLVHPECLIKIKTVDLCGYSNQELETELNNSIRKEVTQPFDLTKLPLIRGVTFKLSEDENIFLLNIHHIVTDGWSTAVIFKELSELYNNYFKGSVNTLPELASQYSDYVNWQLRKNWYPSYDEQLDYWKKQLSGDLPKLNLSHKQRPTSQSLNGSNEYFFLSEDLIQKIQSIGMEMNCSFFMIILAVFQVLLNRYTGIDDIIIGTPIRNRPRKIDKSLIGDFLNVVALRSNLSYCSDFTTLLKQSKKITLEALKNHDLPFGTIVEHLRIERDLSRNPVFQVMLQVSPKYSLELSNLSASPFNFDFCYSQLDLSLHLYQVEDGYNCRFEYDTDLFDREFIKRMISNLKKLMNEIICNPLENLSEYSIVSEDEIRLLNNWNETDTLFSEEKCINQLFEEQAERRSDQIAVKYSNDYLTYGELNSRVNKLANYLIGKGIKNDSIVGIMIDRSINMLIGLLSILKAGAAYVPLDPSFPKEQLQYIVKDSGINILLTEKKLNTLSSIFNVNSICIDSEWEIINKEDEKNVKVIQSSSDLIYVIYTSGSTGNPKGVMIKHSAVNNFLQSMKRYPGFNENDNLLAVTTLSFDIAGLEIYLPLISGACVVIADKADTIDGKALLSLIEKNNVTVMQATPSTWKIMLEAGWENTPGLKMLCGGEAFSKDLADKMLERGGELWNMYGPTETTIWSSVKKIEKTDSKILIGHPIANTKFYVVDKDLKCVPIGIVGELLIGGKGLASGYLNRDNLTQNKFTQSFNNYDGYVYRTGDLVKFHPDGNIEFIGRNDFQVKIRGFRIELGEIETRLLEFENIKEAVVIVNENRNDEKKLVAYFILKNKNVIYINLLITFLKEKVPDYMVPSFFIELDKIPLTPNGKIDRQALPEPDENNIIKIKNESKNNNKDGLEKELEVIWKDILEIRKISNSDNFFTIGGTSLLAIRLIYKLNEKFKIDLPLGIIFDLPTISKLSAEIKKAMKLS